MIEEMKLYEELREDVRHHLNSLLADMNVSNMEIAEESAKLAEILSIHAFNLIAIRDDPVMLPVYGLMCQMICNTINKVMAEEVQK